MHGVLFHRPFVFLFIHEMFVVFLLFISNMECVSFSGKNAFELVLCFKVGGTMKNYRLLTMFHHCAEGITVEGNFIERGKKGSDKEDWRSVRLYSIRAENVLDVKKTNVEA